MKHMVPIGGKWSCLSDGDLAKVSAPARDAYLKRCADYHQNPLAYYLPHGVPWRKKELKLANGRIVLPPSVYPKEYRNDGVAFLNDYENLMAMFLAPRKVGKTHHGAAWIGLRSCETDPNWPIFTEHGIKYREWDGPTKVVVATLGNKNMNDLWSVYQEVLPRRELGPYARDFGDFPGENINKKKSMSFGDGRPKQFMTCHSRTEFVFLTYSQAQGAWESFKAQYLHADEQIPLNLLMAWEDGSSNYGDYTPACFTLSGFCLDERPDTGAAGPLKPMWDSGFHGSKVVARYNMDIEHTPDCILSPGKKKERYDRYVNPELVDDEKALRRGLAVYYPSWEPGSGLLFGPDTWQRDIHMVSPLWDDDKTPQEFTLYRVIDYADKQTTVCGWFAVAPKFAVLYRLLYEKNLLLADAARRIVEMSGNTRMELQPQLQEDTGNIVQYFMEEQTHEQYARTLLDSRAAKWRQQAETVASLFERYGVADVEDAPGARNDEQIPALKDWLRIDYAKAHPFRKDENGEKLLGCPKLFFFDGICDPIVEEIEHMPETETGNMNKRKQHDGIDILKYWAFSGPVYDGDAYKEQYDDRPINTAPFTGY